MIQLFDIHEFLKPVIEVASDLEIDSVVDNTDGTYTVNTVCGTKYLMIGKVVSNNGNDYTVTEINGDIVTLRGLFLPNTTFPLVLADPQYWHGTIRQTNTERVGIAIMSEKTPLVYAPELIIEDYSNDKKSNTWVDIDLTLFFLDESDFTYYTAEFYSRVIKPMRNLCQITLSRLEETIGVKEITGVKVKNYTRFATFDKKTGHDKSLFSENLSGCEARFSLKIDTSLIKCCK